MKKLFIIIALLFLPAYLFSQSIPQKSYLSLNFQAGYLFPFNNSGYSNSQSFEVRPSIQYRLSRTLTFLLEYNICTQKFERTNSSSYTTKNLISFGMRIYPQSKENYYIKPALSLPQDSGPHDMQIIPGFNLGIGYDYILSKELDFFGEAETFNSLNAGTTDFSISAGIKYKIF
jgi:hypothetical protein